MCVCVCVCVCNQLPLLYLHNTIASSCCHGNPDNPPDLLMKIQVEKVTPLGGGKGLSPPPPMPVVAVVTVPWSWEAWRGKGVKKHSCTSRQIKSLLGTLLDSFKIHSCTSRQIKSLLGTLLDSFKIHSCYFKTD